MDSEQPGATETTRSAIASPPAGGAAKPARAARFLITAVALWVVPMLVISVMVALRPAKRTVTPLYHEASANWWAREALYRGPAGMNYLPQFPILFTPFHSLPAPGGDIVWRWLSAAALATGLARVVRLRFGPVWPSWFFGATLLALPLCLGALRNGQANALFGGVLLHAVACLAARQWHRAAVLVVLTLAIKPLGVVLVLLAPVVYTPLRWRVPVALAVLLLLPFVCAPPGYAIAQHRELARNLRDCATLSEHRFADLNGILRTFGTELPPKVSTIVRAMAGLLTATLWWFGARRLKEPLPALWLHALAASYLMLFNPMNESNSYVILAPALAFWAVHWLGRPAWSPRGRLLAAMTLSMGLLPEMLRPWLGNQLALIWHPTMTLIFVGLVAWHVWQPTAAEAASPGADQLRPECP